MLWRFRFLPEGLLPALTVVALGVPAAAETMAVPHARPQPPAYAGTASSPSARPPLPKARPEPRRASPEEGRSGEDGSSPEKGAAPAREPALPSAEHGEETACLSRLTALQVAFEEMAPIDDEGACGAAAPIRVTELPQDISLSPPATLTCRTAEALARWVRDEVVPAAERHLNAEPTGIVQAASYVCRPRNNRPGAKLSEHATASAIDIAAILFEEREAVAVVARERGQTAERRFQRAIRQGACEHFTTVLGPGTDAAHATHFHLDLAQRRRGYRLCQ